MCSIYIFIDLKKKNDETHIKHFSVIDSVNHHKLNETFKIGIDQ